MVSNPYPGGIANPSYLFGGQPEQYLDAPRRPSMAVRGIACLLDRPLDVLGVGGYRVTGVLELRIQSVVAAEPGGC